MSEQTFDNSILEAVFRQAVIDNFERELDEIELEEETCEPIVFSERHERRMAAMFARERRQERMHKVAKWTVRLAAAAAVIFAVLSAALMTVPQVRAAVGGTFVEWFDKLTNFSSDNSVGDISGFEPTYIPSGFAETSRAQTDDLLSIVYSDAKGESLVFYSVPADDSISVNNEGVEYGQVSDGDIVYHTFEAIIDNQTSSVVWEQGGHRFYIGTRIPIVQLTDIARSVGN